MSDPTSSRVSTWTVPAGPTADASTASHRVKLLIVPLLLKVLKLAATRITRQLAQCLFHKRHLCRVIDDRAKIVIGETLIAVGGKDVD